MYDLKIGTIEKIVKQTRKQGMTNSTKNNIK